MAFVWSFWYIVVAVLAIGIIACIVCFVMMDKKDKLIISDFVKKNSETASAEPQTSNAPVNAEPVVVESATEVKAEVLEEKVESESAPENKE